MNVLLSVFSVRSVVYIYKYLEAKHLKTTERTENTERRPLHIVYYLEVLICVMNHFYAENGLFVSIFMALLYKSITEIAEIIERE